MKQTIHGLFHNSGAFIRPFLLLACLLMFSACNIIPAAPDELSSSSMSPTNGPLIETTETADPTGSFQMNLTPTSSIAETPGGASLLTPVSPVWVRAADALASIHSGPGAEFPIIGKLSSGITVQVTGKTNDTEWLQIYMDGSFGWVYSHVVSIDGDLGLVACISTGAGPCANQASAATYDTAIENIRLITQKPDLQVTFIGIDWEPNANQRKALGFVDGKGTTYFVDQETNQVVEFTQIQLSPSSSEIKTLSQLREEAETLAEKDSTRFASLKDSLIYSEGTKGPRYFFSWGRRNTSGAPAGVVAFQVGLDQTGAIVSYLNTLDLPG